MLRSIIFTLTLTAALFAPGVFAPAEAVTLSSDRVFAYAEANYPTLFPGPAADQQFQQYTYRYYPATANYLAVDTANVIFRLGPDTGNVITNVGTVASFADAIIAWEALSAGVTTQNGVTATGQLASIAVSWTDTCTVCSWQLSTQQGNGPWIIQAELPKGSTQYTITGLLPGQNYSVKMAAKRAATWVDRALLTATTLMQFDPRDLSDGYSKLWLITNYAVDGINQPIPSWGADNAVLNSYDGTGLIIYGEIGRPTDTVKVDAFTWRVVGSTIILEGTEYPAPVGRTEAAIVSLTPRVFSYEYDIVVSGGTKKIRVTYESAVAQNAFASPLNLALTAGEVKTWSLKSVVPAGVIPIDPSAPLDRLLILTTDGTGYLTRPDSSGQGGTTTNTDFLRWTTVSDGSVLELIGLDAVGEIPWSSTLVKATSAELVLRGSVFVNGVATNVTMSYAPFIELP